MGEALRDRVGGIRRLYRLLREHGGAVDFDLGRYRPGTNLRHLFTGELTHRELISFIKHLPLDSATVRQMHPGESHWDPAYQRLTDIADLLLLGNWQRGGDEHAPKPDMFPRPGAEQPAPKQQHLTPEEFDALFD